MRQGLIRCAAVFLATTSSITLMDSCWLAGSAAEAAVVGNPKPEPKFASRELAKPRKAAEIAGAPPQGSKPSNALLFDKSLRWKSDPKTHSVFAIDSNQQIWFIDPNSGWPYTIDRKGVVYTANARTGNVYIVNTITNWSAPWPYFFRYWSYSNGFYVVPAYGTYAAIYSDSSINSFTYNESYTLIWEENTNYFDSEAFNAESFSQESINPEPFNQEPINPEALDIELKPEAGNAFGNNATPAPQESTINITPDIQQDPGNSFNPRGGSIDGGGGSFDGGSFGGGSFGGSSFDGGSFDGGSFGGGGGI